MEKKKEYKKLSKEEVQERARNGLCFKCGEKWDREHKCKTRQIFLIESTSDEKSEWTINKTLVMMQRSKEHILARMRKMLNYIYTQLQEWQGLLP